MKFFIAILSMLMSISIFAQTNFNKGTTQLNDLLNASSDKDELLVWVFFNDKGDNTAHYFANPESVVSVKSLKRRAKVLTPDELISEMDLPVNSEYIEKVVSLGFELKQKSKWFNGVSGYLTKSEIGLISQLSTVKSLDVVHKFKKDYSIEEDAGNQPQGSSLYKQNGINSFDYGQSFTQLNQINVPAVHDMGFTGQGITICSMDAGFDNLAHEVFSSMNIIAMWDFVDGDPDVSQLGSHGTSTLSTIGGFKEGRLIGPAFDSDFILARTEDILSETPVEEDNWIAALEWADSIGVDVTTTSLSYLEFDPPFQSYTWEDMDGNTALITIAADLAVKLGIVVVNSASNSGFNPNHNTLGAPADGDSVITVGAVGSDGERSGFSSVGPTVDGRIKPDLMAMGSGVYVARSSSPTSYGTSGGTSFSCPILAGAAALVLSVDPTLTPMELLDLLRQTASRSSNPDNLMGWGIINTLDAIELIPVPVELTLFSGRYINGSVQLEWTTATETNNFGFEVQKRYDNTSYEKIGFVPGNGTTTNGMQYSFEDNDLFAGRIFYRLKQLDFNGEFEYSSEILVEVLNLTNYQLFQNYPNPFNPNTSIKYSVPVQSKIKIKITLYDIIGNEVSTLFDGIQQSGVHEINLTADNLPSGVYFISMTAENFNKAIKITLMK
ncbi:MAG: S8 family peptidase [Bacteroidetes bacterium]|nr:S8 family peptidase [Bacteroidota bacterium]